MKKIILMLFISLILAVSFYPKVGAEDTSTTCIIVGSSTTLSSTVNVASLSPITNPVTLSYTINPPTSLIDVTFDKTTLDPTDNTIMNIKAKTGLGSDAYQITATASDPISGFSSSAVYTLNVIGTSPAPSPTPSSGPTPTPSPTTSPTPSSTPSSGCNSDNDCGGGFGCQKKVCNMVTHTCQFLPAGQIPANKECGKRTEACADICSNPYTYTQSKSCDIGCNGAGSCSNTCTLPAACSISTCKYYCKYGCNSGNTDCESGYYCPPKTASCKICDGGTCGLPNGKSCTYPNTPDSCITPTEYNSLKSELPPGRVLCSVSCTCCGLWCSTGKSYLVTYCGACGGDREPHCGGADCSPPSDWGCWSFKWNTCFQSDTKCTKTLACSSSPA